MEYVFFDIECACVYKNVAKICVFGYCVADENFNIIKKEDILINPNGKFHLTDRGGDGIVLPYDYEDFKKYPDFKKFYPRIRELLEGEDKTVFGHAAINDVKYLNLETKRYRLPSFRFRFADTQVLYMAMTETFDRQAGLESLTQIFEIDYTPHCAADDAYATMRIAQEMCEKENCTLPELLEKYGIRFGRIENYQFSNCSSRRRSDYLKEKSRLKRERGEKRAKFNDFVYGYRVRPQSDEFRGRRFSFSRSIEEELPLAKRLVKEIVRRGGKYSLKLSGCNTFVEEEGDESVRCEAAHKLQSEGKISDIFTLSDFSARYLGEEE
ncbi:MAG TPA: hypothetical protein H9726_07615 [Candidatus Borkfalkia avicola]|uniref:Exonuclease domain-containing protein n=1 Tax=Candidatus Borkfalkia avicola TaxID=2838503 RepID=A0A9D2D883_9FIRM|nr:hypothetical protein [Candidatus Borkfalkia avicola]